MRTLRTDATPRWLALGNDQVERSSAYRALLDEILSGGLLASTALQASGTRIGYANRATDS